MARKPIRVEKSSGNVFLDIGFDETEAAELLAKAKLSLELQRAIRARGLTQKAERPRPLGRDQGQTRPRPGHDRRHWCLAP
jgi:hypothetical protein